MLNNEIPNSFNTNLIYRIGIIPLLFSLRTKQKNEEKLNSKFLTTLYVEVALYLSNLGWQPG